MNTTTSQRPLSKAQRELLAELVSYGGEGRITAQGRRTARVLEDRGLIRYLVGGGSWYRVTPEGHAAHNAR